MNNNGADNLSIILGILNLELLLRDYNNTDLMNELQNQDTTYFKKIIEQNDEILKFLRERSEDNGRINP